MHNRYLLFGLIIMLIGCGGNREDTGLELTDEQVTQLLKNRPPAQNMPGEAQNDEALRQLEAAYQQDSSQIENVYNLAFMYCQICLADSSAASCSAANRYLSRTINLQNDYREGKAHFNQMLCRQVQGNTEEALESLNQYIALNKANPKVPVNYHLHKALLLQQLDRTEEACKALQQATQLDTTGLAYLQNQLNCPQ